MNGFERFGWFMFTLSGVFFLALGLRDGELLTSAGAVVWMIGCVAFLVGGNRQVEAR